MRLSEMRLTIDQEVHVQWLLHLVSRLRIYNDSGFSIFIEIEGTTTDAELKAALKGPIFKANAFEIVIKQEAVGVLDKRTLSRILRTVTAIERFIPIFPVEVKNTGRRAANAKRKAAAG